MERQNKDGKTPRVTYILGNHDWWLIKAIGIIKKYDLKTEELKEILQNEDSIKQIGVLKETRPSSTILLEDIKFLKLYAHIIKGEETIIDFSELPKEQQIKVEEFLKNSSIFISKKIGGKNIALAHAVPFELNTEGKLYQDIKYRDIDSEIAIIEFLQTDIEKVKDRIQAYKDGGFLTIVGHMAQSNGLIKRNDGYIIVDAACSGYGRLALYCIEDDKEIYIDPKEDVGGSVGGNR